MIYQNAVVFVHCPKHDQQEVLSEVDAARFIELVCSDDWVKSDQGAGGNKLCPIKTLEIIR